MKETRDLNIKKSYQNEISLRTRVTKNKKKYNRKIKHKNKEIYKKLSVFR